MAKGITDFVLSCGICQHISKSKSRKPILERTTPKLPFEQVATDLFIFEDEDYVVLIDNYIEYERLQKSASSKEVIEKLKRWLAVHHGQPQHVYSDNGPQYLSIEFKKCAQEWNFEHVTSSPKYPKSNVVKGILKKCKIDGSGTQLTIHHGMTSWDLQHKD
jgi:hypothetical protein